MTLPTSSVPKATRPAGIDRRRLLKAGVAGAAAVPFASRLAGAASGPAGPVVPFPDGFLWGASTSAYQIEGAHDVDGRTPSIWDTFSRTPGKVEDGHTGDIAADHYRRYPEDVALMANAGLKAYRLSTSWPRILPQGTGAVNAAGLDFYDRLVDALLAAGIQPWVCLYHWDLPQALQDRGGWLNRDIADWFVEYALVVSGRLGDRVRHWVMLNEPGVVSLIGHGAGGHAPDIRGRDSYFASAHHQNLAQGRALHAMRSAGGGRWELGTVLSVQPARPVTPTEPDIRAALVWDALWNRAFLDPLFKGAYPEAVRDGFAPLVRDGDMDAIRFPVDFLGLNYYSRMHMRADPGGLFGTAHGPAPQGTPYTGMPWPVEPDGLFEQLMDFRDRYGNPPVYVTENGAAYPDPLGPDGRIEDGDRIGFLRDHLLWARRAIDQGCDLRGYFVWTLLDNFEWAFGYTKNFGLVRVELGTLRRVPKASYHWYAEVVRANAVPAA
ncbi:MAG TPA: GH1 family beta-glucosidase [Azospirillaceae bacterium]|nr:GH1 family beta-glucosidase [Azospirillaceae bacterium]